jgi:hypothetical protein
MRKVLIPLACAVALLVASTPAAAQGVQARGDQLVEINGRVSPALIPDYLVWEQLFRVLARTGGHPSVGPLSDNAPAFTVADRQRIVFEAEASIARTQACELQLLDEFDALRAAGAAPDVILKVTRDLTLACRIATLAAVDAMLEDISESAQFSLSAMAVEHRSEMSVVLLARDIAFFRLPR